jgi:hypothetical protein
MKLHNFNERPGLWYTIVAPFAGATLALTAAMMQRGSMRTDVLCAAGALAISPAIIWVRSAIYFQFSRLFEQLKRRRADRTQKK